MSIVIRSYGSWVSPSTLAQEDLRSATGQLEALAPHLLDEDGELELAAAADLERVARFGREDLDGDVAERPRCSRRALIWRLRDELALAAGQRRGVDPERHPERRRVDVEARQRPRIGRVGERVADRDLGRPATRDDVARPASSMSTRSIHAPSAGS